MERLTRTNRLELIGKGRECRILRQRKCRQARLIGDGLVSKWQMVGFIEGGYLRAVQGKSQQITTHCSITRVTADILFACKHAFDLVCCEVECSSNRDAPLAGNQPLKDAETYGIAK